MMNVPLLITSIMRHANTYRGTREIISVTGDDPRHRCTYAQAFRRSAKLVLPGAKAGDPETLHDLMETESVTAAIGGRKDGRLRG